MVDQELGRNRGKWQLNSSSHQIVSARIASSRNVLQSHSLTHEEMFSVSVSAGGVGDVQAPASWAGADQERAPGVWVTAEWHGR